MKENSNLKDPFSEINSQPTVSNIIMMQCASCERPYGTTDISQIFCYECNELTKQYQKSKEE